MEESLRDALSKNQQNEGTIKHLKEQLGNSVQSLGTKFKEVEQKH